MAERLDLALVSRGLVQSREKAHALVLAGAVRVAGQRADKPGRLVPSDILIEVNQQPRYVSRGGTKLEAALQTFAVDVSGKVCLDVGTSTGGFVDCLLQHGALRVHAVDTGAGQIDWKLRGDPRVTLHERCNARFLKLDQLGEPVEVIAIDVSFISVTLILPAVIGILEPDGHLIVLVKPQFEAGRAAVEKGGIVRDPAAHTAARNRVIDSLRTLGFRSRVIDSPIKGSEGNREFLLHAQRVAPAAKLSFSSVPV